MAMFPTHIKCSTATGIVGGIVACVGYGVPFTTSAVGAGMCAIGGILPDIDSGPGIPLREITTFLASVVPTMLITRMLSYHLTQESLILVGAILYVGIRFGLAHFLRHYTVHRGMFHSFPSMAIFGELTYLLFYGESKFVRIFMVSAVCLGFFIHLLLDEIYSVEWDGRPRLKKSFGTAMKFAGDNWWANVTCFGKLAICTYFVLVDPSIVQQISANSGQQVASNVGDNFKDSLSTATAAIRAKTSGGNGPLASFLSKMSAPASGAAPTNNSPNNSPAASAPGSAWASTRNNGPTMQSAVQPGTNPYAPAAVPETSQPAPATANWSVPAANVSNYPSRSGRGSNPPAAISGNYYPAAGNQPATPPPVQPAATGRFW